MIDMDLVNVVGGGDLGTSINLHYFADTQELPSQSYEPEIYSGLKFKLHEDKPTILLFSSGKYHITGATSIDELHETHKSLKEFIESELSVELDEVTGPDVRNLVYVVDYGREVDLNGVSIALGLENIEYNPENHPSLHYTPEKGGHVMLFRTGKIILTGVKNANTAKTIIDQFTNQLDSLFDL